MNISYVNEAVTVYYKKRVFQSRTNLDQPCFGQVRNVLRLPKRPNRLLAVVNGKTPAIEEPLISLKPQLAIEATSGEPILDMIMIRKEHKYVTVIVLIRSRLE